MSKKPDTEKLRNIRFGKLVTLHKINKKDTRGRPRVYWLCQCDCGTKKEIRQETLGAKANSCGCVGKPPTIPSNQHHLWQGFEEMSGAYLKDIQRKAESAGRLFSVTPDFLWSLFLRQKRMCRLTGLPIQFRPSRRLKEVEQTASLDRIDSSKDYTTDNVQWVHKDVNRMKNVFTQKRFVEVCNLVSKLHRNT